ncbi:MAG: gluconokinase [Cyclobacteriaceae bacterium]|nr:gluconokinase [Cyclobacteriaceae bacterium]
MNGYVIGIDIGTGSTKAVAVDALGTILFSTAVTYPAFQPQEGYHEQAPELIWQAFIKCIQRTIRQAKEQPKGISLSSAMHSVIPVDAAGSPLMNMITWADNRSDAIATRIKNSGIGEMLYEQTGTPIHAMAPLSKIVWLKEHDPALFQRTHKFISIKEYIWYKLFGVYEIDYSLASATGLFDINQCNWNANSLDLCAISSEKLSTPVPSTYTRDSTTASPELHTILNQPVPIFIGSSDGCMANLGSFATEPGIAALTIGTSSAIRITNAQPTFNFAAMTFNYILDETTFISGGPSNNGGAVLKWYAESFLQQKLTTSDDYEVMLQELDHSQAGSEGLRFLPYVLGERAPIWNSDACGVFFGIKNMHIRKHFTRAVIEGICFALYSIATSMEDSGLTISRIHVSGGFVHSKTWLQMLADIFNKEVYLIHQEDASALGAAYLGLKMLGMVDNYAELKPATSTSFLPREEDHQAYQTAFVQFRRLYHLLQEEMKQTS